MFLTLKRENLFLQSYQTDLDDLLTDILVTDNNPDFKCEAASISTRRVIL